jgi:hypothetical protein
VHPSWRDLVIEALARDAEERRRFLSRCGVDGAALALSTAGGAAGERRRPLLREDRDWDALADGLHHLSADLDEEDAVRLLAVLADAEPDPEVAALAGLVARRLARCWRAHAVSVDALAAWAAVAAPLVERPEPPSPAATWLALEPAGAPATPLALERFADWLRLVELLDRHDPQLLAGLGFPLRHLPVLAAFAESVPIGEPPFERELRRQALERLAALVPEYAAQARATIAALDAGEPALEWEPPAVAAPPSTRFPVGRVLADLVD